MEHTPGPYKAIKTSQPDMWDICCSNTPGSQEIGQYSPSIAVVHNNVRIEHIKDREEANARLLAAAPDMCEALVALVSLMDGDDPVEVGCHCTYTGVEPGGLLKCAWCMAKEALAKVRG